MLLPTEKKLTVASAGWSPGTKGRITGEVVVMTARNKEDLEKYRGKLRNAIVLSQPPSTIPSVSQLAERSGQTRRNRAEGCREERRRQEGGRQEG